MAYLNEDGLETLVGKIKGQVIELTSAEYRQLPETKNSDNKLYFVNDEAYAYQIDDEPTSGSSGLVKSGGVYNWTSKIGSGTLTTAAQTIIPAVNELNAKIGSTDGNLSSLTNTVWEWETFQGTVAGVAQTFYRKRLGNVYIMFGAGSVNVAIGAGTTSQRQIVYTNKPFTAVYGGAANLSVGGQVDSHARYVAVGRDLVDAWLYNPATTTASTIVYNFIVIGIAS